MVAQFKRSGESFSSGYDSRSNSNKAHRHEKRRKLMWRNSHSVRVFKNTLRNSGILWTITLILDRFGVPVFRLWPEVRISPDVLERQIGEILKKWGMAEEHIAIAVQYIIYADIHGIDSHGSSMLLHYHRQLLDGSLNINPEIKILRENETSVLMDGGSGFGHIAAVAAMKKTIEKCAATGIGISNVRNSGHFGAAGAYAEMAAQSGFIGIAMTSVKVPALVPTFGLSAMLGTNPIAFASPALRNRPFLLDMATTTVPVGKLSTIWRRGRPIPKDWALNERGRSIRNPRKGVKYRRLTPLGGTHRMRSYKGYGLAAMVEILTTILPGEYDTGGVGHFFLALDPGRFQDIDTFRNDMDTFMDKLRATKPKHPGQPVLIPGDPEYSIESERHRHGIPFSRGTIEDIRAVCNASKTPFYLMPEYNDRKEELSSS
jgi:LDH2 family malate/lactate/ureidoglycolate dehydrogenase